MIHFSVYMPRFSIAGSYGSFNSSFKGISPVFSILAISISIPHLFSKLSPAFTACTVFDDGHSDLYEVTSHCNFDVHFSHDEWCSSSFHVVMSLLPLCISFLKNRFRIGENSADRIERSHTATLFLHLVSSIIIILYWFNGYRFVFYSWSTNVNMLLLTIIHCLQYILLFVFYSSLLFERCMIGSTQPTRCRAEECERPMDLPCSICSSLKTSLGTPDNYSTFYSFWRFAFSRL